MRTGAVKSWDLSRRARSLPRVPRFHLAPLALTLKRVRGISFAVTVEVGGFFIPREMSAFAPLRSIPLLRVLVHSCGITDCSKS